MSVAKALFLPLVVVLAVFLVASLHRVEEGHVGLYWRGGALLSDITEPGFHVMVPIVTTMANVQTTLQTDTVTNIPCGTSGGVMIYFDKVEVVNMLSRENVYQTVKNYGVYYDKIWIFDKIHHEINQFCSSHSLQEVYISEFDTLDEALATALQEDCNKWNTGITIVSIRVTKPRIPDRVRQNYEEVEQQKTSLLVASEQQNVVKKEEETLRLKAKIQAQKEAEVAAIRARKEATVAAINAQKEANVSLLHVKMEILEKQGEQKRQRIENEMHLERQHAIAAANKYRLNKEAEANARRLTPEYLRVQLYQALSNNTRAYFGDKIPQVWAGGASGGVFGTTTPHHH
eukprot:TRINITY_DN12777_c0_g1_i1.p1 TRINITY_DN12777_c0_g1~~TRINITY_DN12777_c0_g1_i1.p1  ORF type:complete len:345 (-),score=80.79 TRINITY_DN12777_c0_g1_i1:58-1092(-)